MKIRADFPGGNIVVQEIGEDVVRIERDIRDTEGDWFYWAFSAEEVRNALAFLTRAKFLKKTADDVYEQVDRSLQMSVAAMPVLVREMHKEMADFAKESIEKYPIDERNFTGITMGIDDEDYAEILKELETCRKRIISIATAKKGGNRVYRLNMQMFPLTEKIQNNETSLKNKEHNHE